MTITKLATSGTLESSDVHVTVQPGNNGVELTLESSVINQYGRQIKAVVLETLGNLNVADIQIKVVDRGALDCTLKARVENAVFRGAENTDKVNWGGIVK